MEMMNKDRCLIMFAKYPEKGKVKSRLCQHWDEGLVVLLYRSFIEDLLDRLSGGDYRFRIAYHPVGKKGAGKSDEQGRRSGKGRYPLISSCRYAASIQCPDSHRFGVA
jgi:hypothetical protein